MRRDLDETCGFGEVERGVADFGEEDRVDLVVELEVGKNLETLGLRSLAVDEGLLEFQCVSFQRVDVVREDDDFVAALFVVVD